MGSIESDGKTTLFDAASGSRAQTVQLLPERAVNIHLTTVTGLITYPWMAKTATATEQVH